MEGLSTWPTPTPSIEALLQSKLAVRALASTSSTAIVDALLIPCSTGAPEANSPLLDKPAALSTPWPGLPSKGVDSEAISRREGGLSGIREDFLLVCGCVWEDPFEW